MTERPRRRKLATVQPAQPAPLPPAGLGTTVCGRCRAHYLDYPDGRDAHKVVFGHTPAPKDDGKDN